MGYEHFIANLSAIFPADRDAIIAYCDKVKETCQKIPLYNLRADDHYDDLDMMRLNAQEEIAKLTSNTKLQAVLAGSNMLYAGDGAKTPWFVHALIINSYIESCWRCTKTGEQIAKLLAKSIRAQGGTILTKTGVVKIIEQEGQATGVELVNGEVIEATKFISTLHPSVTLDMLDSTAIKGAYRSRIKGLPNSISAFVLNISLKSKSYPYSNRNYYYFANEQVWDTLQYTEENFPLTYGLFESVPTADMHYLEAASIMTYMRWDEVAQWQDTINTTVNPSERGETYEQFKQRKAEKLLSTVAIKFPDLVANIEHWYASTPLTYRDYLNTPKGSIYGIAKDNNDPVKTLISPNTKIPNLYLTGQNLKLHGVLGVSLSALVTCSAIIGREYLVNKIIAANEVVA
jgi:all-trans-retinol 13,14-reductase